MSDDTQENNSNLQNTSNNSEFEQFPTSQIDNEIEQARKHFYGLLMNKKRNIRRNFLQMNAITNEHLLETLSYRTMLQPPLKENYGSIEQAHEKDANSVLSQPQSSKNTSDSPSSSPAEENEGIVLQISAVEPVEENKEHDDWLDSETDLEIQKILNEENTS